MRIKAYLARFLKENSLQDILDQAKPTQTALIYTQLVTFQNDDYTCKVAANIKEAAELIEAGYEYVCEMDQQKLFRSINKMAKNTIAQTIWIYTKELGMGIEPSKIGYKSLGFGVWRYRCYSFFAASFPFFLVKGFRLCEQDLSGNEIVELKNSKLPSLWKNPIPRFLRRNEKKSSEMPKLRELSNGKRRETIYANRCNSALSLQRLRNTIFRTINQIAKQPFFFFNSGFRDQFLILARRRKF